VSLARYTPVDIYGGYCGLIVGRFYGLA